jgi:hypothetical protein
VVVQAEAPEQQDWQTVAAVEVEASHLAALVRLAEAALSSSVGTHRRQSPRSLLV